MRCNEEIECENLKAAYFTSLVGGSVIILVEEKDNARHHCNLFLNLKLLRRMTHYFKNRIHQTILDEIRILKSPV